MSSNSRRSFEDDPSSIHSSITDIPVDISPRHSSTELRTEELRLRQSSSLDINIPELVDDDLDIEDPLSRIYVRDDEFERFSKTETGFIVTSCIGVIAVPLLYLLVSRSKVISRIEKMLMEDITRFLVSMEVKNDKEQHYMMYIVSAWDTLEDYVGLQDNSRSIG
jgi:hypothetical protein